MVADILAAYNTSIEKRRRQKLGAVLLGGATVGFTLAKPPDLRLPTWHQRQVLSWRSEGFTDGATARRMALSENTVKTHVKGLFRKLRARDISEAHMKLAVMEERESEEPVGIVPVFTPRQLALCTGVVLGMTNSEIGAFMKPGQHPLAEDTIKTGLRKPFKLLDIKSRDEMAPRMSDLGFFVALPLGYELPEHGAALVAP